MSKSLDTKVTSIKKISSALLNYADSFSFIIREATNVSNATIELLDNLKIYLIETKRVSEWPGTKLLWEQAVLYTYSLNNESAYLLFTTEDHLFKWLLPQWPEDLAFYKNNKPFFVSITHEKEAYFELEGKDEIFLKDKDLI
jgi:hypothetical protein